MKTIVTKDNLQREWVAEGVYIGELTYKASRALSEQGYDLADRELVGRFNGVRTFMDYMENNWGKFGGRSPKHSDASRKDEGSSWTKYHSYEQGVAKMRNEPWVFRAFTPADIYLTDYQNAGIDVEYGVYGDYLDIGRFMSGEPEVFGIMRDGLIIQDFCQITVNGNHSAGTDHKDIDRMAQRVMRLVDALETAKVRCEVGIIFSNDNSHSEILIKQYQDVLDINDLSVAMSPDFFRRMQFVFSEHSSTLRYGYGQARAFRAETLKDPDAPKSIIIGNELYNLEEQFDNLENKITTEGVVPEFTSLCR